MSHYDINAPDGADIKQRDLILSINGKDFKELLQASLVWLKKHQPLINSLNVFPVPDGDTGTNMYLTLQSAFNEIEKSSEINIGKIVHMVAQGALMGARGNSGVILSQLLRGFARALDESEIMDSHLLCNAFMESRNTAYKGVVRPVEGTILTVAKEIAKTAEENMDEKDILNLFEKVLIAADESVKNTPNLLPILKQAGVVDSGGKGLFIILEGMYRQATNQPVDVEEIAFESHLVNLDQIKLDQIHQEVEPGQDFEVVVDFRPAGELNLEKFYEDLSEIGTSVQVGEGDDLYRMHIHVATEKKYDPIELVSKYGSISKIYLENLLEQMESSDADVDLESPVEDGQIAIIAVSPGSGISKIFKSLGVTRIVNGGQSMNPSTNEIFQTFKDLPTDKIILLPNNKNIILAANEAKNLSDKNVTVIPTKSIPQGLVSCLRLNPNGNYDDIVEEMEEAISEVETGEITTATRSITINGIKVKKGEVIALLDGELVSSSKSITTACDELLAKANMSDREHITIFYGKDTDEKLRNNFVDNIKTKYPDHELELHNGGQPHYQFILSIE
jgi:DAK2 domain fusion protein YloV